MTKETVHAKNLALGWIRCTDECYPEHDTEVIIAFFEPCDNKWYFWTRNTCPYGWNILIKSEAYFKIIGNPISYMECGI